MIMADADNKDKNEVKMTWRVWGGLLVLLIICATPVTILVLFFSDYVLLAILFLPMVAMVVLGALNVKI